jgi:hypothetical protein
MRVARLNQLEEMAAKLLATARELSAGQDRHNALREIGRFRARISALQTFDLRRTHEGEGKTMSELKDEKLSSG